MTVVRQFVRHLDYVTILSVLLLLAIGLITIFSAAYKSGLGEVRPYFSRQCLWVVLGLVAMIVAVLIDYRIVSVFSYVIYFAIMLLLLALLIMGREVHGAQRWFRLFGFQIQPSEIIKLAVLFALARYLDDIREGIRKFRCFLVAVAIAGIPAAMVVLQPDLGSALVLVALLGGMLIAANARRRHLAALCISGVALFPVLWGFLKDYQKDRLLSFVNPNLDPLGSSYQVIQSQIAIGAGGFLGKGWLGGTQSQLNFLPEQHTDFIFSVFAEQWGFVGASILTVLYVLLLLQALKIAESARDFLGSMVAVGIISVISFQIFVNLLMTVGLMPVTGIPLPFLSYGGSDLLVMMTCVGILLGIEMRSRVFV